MNPLIIVLPLLLGIGTMCALGQMVPAQASPSPKPPVGTPTPATPATRPSPASPPAFGRATATPTSAAALISQAPRDVKLVEKKFEELTNKEISLDGKKALDIKQDKWKHAETDNFVLHFRRVTEAQKVAREVEFDLWFVATSLGATRDRYQNKSHVYIFEDDEEWKEFLGLLNASMQWAVSFARGDELFLNVRGNQNSAGFQSDTVAHETTHAVVARLYGYRRRWPIWLNEGFAEYMGGASVAARKGQSVKGRQGALNYADMPLWMLEALTEYPSDEVQRAKLYQSGEKFVRFLMNEFPKDRITAFIDKVLGGADMKTAVIAVYGDKVKDWESFERRYERFSK